MMSEMNPGLGGVGLKGKGKFIGKLKKRTVLSVKFCEYAAVCHYWQMSFSVGFSPHPESGCSMIKFSRHGRMMFFLVIEYFP